MLSPVNFGGNRTGVVKLNVIEYSEESQSNKIHENKILEIVDAELDTTGKTAKKIETGFNPVPQLSPLCTQEDPVSAISAAEMLGYVKGNDSKYLPSSTSYPQHSYGENTVGAAEKLNLRATKPALHRLVGAGLRL